MDTKNLQLLSTKPLVVRKNLPYIILPKEKNELFIDWYLEDLIDLEEEIPKVFNEGYLTIDASNIILIKTHSILDMEFYKNNKKLLDEELELANAFKEDYGSIIVYFKFIENGIIITEHYDSHNIKVYEGKLNATVSDYKMLYKNMKKTSDMISAISKLEEHKVYAEKKTNQLIKKAFLDLTIIKSNPKELPEKVKIFQRLLADICNTLVISVIWYLATNKSEKYIVNDNTEYVDNYNQNYNNYNYKKHKSDHRVIKAPIYNLQDKRPVTIEKLIKRRNGWTISHSFGVRGHYRHYKNGKVVFIQSYTKGKELENFENKKIIISPD